MARTRVCGCRGWLVVATRRGFRKNCFIGMLGLGETGRVPRGTGVCDEAISAGIAGLGGRVPRGACVRDEVLACATRRLPRECHD